MCGRFTLRTPLRQVAEAFKLEPSLLPDPASWPLRYNVAPTQQVAAVRERGEGGRELAWLQWGLIPSWASDPAIGNRMINARSETLATKPAYREAFRRRRCLVPADGFYEWKKLGKAKQPYYIQVDGGSPFALAGLWEHWRHGELVIDSCTIVTTSANELLRPLHERMPVILPPDRYAAWLDPQEHDTAKLEPLLAPFPPERMSLAAVSTLVNSPRHDTPDCLAPQTQRTQGTLFD